MNILVISASAREGRTSHGVALYLASKLGAQGHDAQILDLKTLPMPALEYVLAKAPNPDEAYLDAREQLRWADAMIFVSPEYNGTYTAALKNLVDHMSKAEFAKKVIGISTPTTGALGGMRAALSLQELVLALWAIPVPQMLPVSFVDKKVSADGVLLDPAWEKAVDTYLSEFTWLASAVVNHKVAVAV